jgi:hypothetical protein
MSDTKEPATFSVTVGDGKYTVQHDASGRLVALRYGEPWRDCCGDGLIFTLAWELAECRAELARVTAISTHMPAAAADRPPQPHFTEYPPL